MPDIALRDLKNRLSEVVREAEGGVEYVVTVDRRPVAQLGPLPLKPTWLTPQDFVARFAGRWADPGLLDELDEIAGDRVDEL